MKKSQGCYSTVTKGITQGILKLEISNLLSDLKQDIIKNVAKHLDIMIAKKKQAKTKL